MLENPSLDSTVAVAGVAAVNGSAASDQRNMSLGRRKSKGDGEEWTDTCVNDGESNPTGVTKSGAIADHGEGVGSNRAIESLQEKLIPLHGCCDSEALQLLNNRWTAAMSAYKSLPEDSAERPVLYTKKSTSAWNHAFLPHLMIQPTGGASADSQRDFLDELRQAMHNADTCLTPVTGARELCD